MGRKLDLSGLTDNEAEHVLQVVQRDMRLRKNEEERLSELKQELDEEGSRCLLLSRQSCFNQRCCIRCCSPFTFLLNPKRQCRDCLFNVCKACRVYNKRDKAWLCSVCQKSRLVKTQSLEWFYTNVKTRFKRFGSAKVLKTLYRKHLVEQSALAELTEGSAYEESTCNEGSVCGSDSTFYRQTQEHNNAETLTVALRVAEEAIDEAISEAEFDTSSQIISRRNTLADINTKYDQDWPLEHNTDHHFHRRQSSREQACISFKNQPGIWRRHSAFALLDMDSPGLVQQTHQALKKEGGGSAMSTWKSVDRLDNPVLKSPDGNWIALQSAQLSRPSLLTRRKSLVYSVLERESVVVSAYEGMGSDNETKPELESSWGAVLQEIHRKMTDSNCSLHDTEDRISPQLMDRRGSRDNLFSDSEGNWKLNKPLLGVLKRKVPAEIRRPSSSPRTSIIDVNFNVEGAGVESSAAAEPAAGKVRRSRKKRESKKEPGASSVLDYNKKDNPSQHTSDAVTSDTLTSGATTPEPFNLLRDMSGHGANQMEQDLTLKLQQLIRKVSDAEDDAQSEERRQRNKDKDQEDERQWRVEIGLGDGRKEKKKNEQEEKDVDEEEMKDRLHRLVAQSRLTYFSSTDDELDRAGLSEGEWDGERDENMEEQIEEKTEGLTYKLCQLEKEVRATQFSSTEDELDRFGITDEEKKTGEEEELAVKVCRLANKVNVTQFSSTEDELDGRGEEGEEATDEVTIWKLQASQVRDLASLLSASQFSSTEDELEEMGENEGQIEHKVNEGGIESSIEMRKVWEGAVGKSHERRETIGDLDVKMFDLREENERKNERSKEKVEKEMTENVLDHQIKYEVQPEKAKVDEPEEKITEEAEGERLVGKVFKEAEERQEMELETVEEAERKEVIALYETRVGIENQTEAEWSDKKEAEERREEEKIRESKQSQGKWEMASDSEEEDAEFDRIISSMLLMTVEDMQVEMLPDKGENERMNRETDEGEEVDSKTYKTGNAKDRCDKARPDSDVKEGPGENITGQTARDISTRQESGDATGRKKNKQQEKDTDPQEKKPIDITNQETDEAKQTRRRTEVYVENTGGGMTTEREMMGAQGDAAEGECENKDTRERVEETKEKHTDDMEQSCTSSLQEGLLSPEEIQNVYVAAGTVYNLEAELNDLEECARSICSATSDMELSFLEEQVASAAAKVQQSELQICDISARIAALKSAGLDVDPQSCFSKTRSIPVMVQYCIHTLYTKV
ncbi:hypothetical protein PAMP_005101 [Pampus punctatissimus]